MKGSFNLLWHVFLPFMLNWCDLEGSLFAAAITAVAYVQDLWMRSGVTAAQGSPALRSSCDRSELLHSNLGLHVLYMNAAHVKPDASRRCGHTPDRIQPELHFPHLQLGLNSMS